MDDYLQAPDYDGWDDATAVLVATGRIEPYVSPENITDYAGTRSWGGVA